MSFACDGVTVTFTGRCYCLPVKDLFDKLCCYIVAVLLDAAAPTGISLSSASFDCSVCH